MKKRLGFYFYDKHNIPRFASGTVYAENNGRYYVLEDYKKVVFVVRKNEQFKGDFLVKQDINCY